MSTGKLFRLLPLLTTYLVVHGLFQQGSPVNTLSNAVALLLDSGASTQPGRFGISCDRGRPEPRIASSPECYET